MKSRAWYLQQAIRQSPNTTVLPQRDLDAALGLAGRLPLTRLVQFISPQAHVDCIFVPEQSASGLLGAGLHRTSEGGFVISIPITRLAVLSVLNAVLQTVSAATPEFIENQEETRERAMIEVFSNYERAAVCRAIEPVFSSLTKELLVDPAVRGWARGECARIFYLNSSSHKELDQAWNDSKLAVGKALTCQEQRLPLWDALGAPQSLFFWCLPMDERLALLEEVMKRALASKGPIYFDQMLHDSMTYSLLFTLLHEIAHFVDAHYERVAYGDVESEHKWSIEFLADRYAFDAIVERFVKPECDAGRLDRAAQLSNSVYTGLAWVFCLQFACRQDEWMEYSLACEDNSAPPKYPPLVCRWHALRRRFASLRLVDPAEIDAALLRRIGTAANHIDFPGLRALSGLLSSDQPLSDAQFEKLDAGLESAQFFNILAKRQSKHFEEWKKDPRQFEQATIDGAAERAALNIISERRRDGHNVTPAEQIELIAACRRLIQVQSDALRAKDMSPSQYCVGTLVALLKQL
jgi:hypothetical protein